MNTVVVISIYLVKSSASGVVITSYLVTPDITTTKAEGFTR
jgi:hypothetical protein